MQNRGRRRQKSFISIRVTYTDSDRVDLHSNLSGAEVDAIRLIPYAKVEVLEIFSRRQRKKKNL